MVPERFERYIVAATRARIAALAKVPTEDWMQDWPLEVADASRLDEFIALLEQAEDDDDRFALMELVLFSVDDAAPTKRQEVWPAIEALLVEAPMLHARELIYWSCGDEADDGMWKFDDLDEVGGFKITTLMRSILVRVASTIGLQIA